MYSISEVCRLLDVRPHVLRYWERMIPLVAPGKDRYGRRTYTQGDVNRLARVRYLVQERGLSTTSAARQLWSDAEGDAADARSAIAEIRGELLRAKALIGRRREDTSMDQGVRERLAHLGQEHLLAGWDGRGQAARARLAADLQDTDLSVLGRFTELTGGGPAGDVGLEPAPYIAVSDRDDAVRRRGLSVAAAGKTAFLTVAGGQGSRLGFDGPKGMYRVTPVRRASLFQVFAEKLLGFRRACGAQLPWYIMTSPENHAPTVAYFKEQFFFGLPETDVHFFPQGTLPTLDANGRLLLSPEGGLLRNPDGHGGLVQALVRHKMIDDMRRRGVEHLFYFQVDNPLVIVPDPLFLGYHVARGGDVSVKVIAKRSPDEKLGVIAIRDAKACIVEYSDLDEQRMNARDASGRLLFEQGSIAIHILSVEFLARRAADLPLHVARKKVKALDPATGATTEREGVKLERFIFDLLPLADRVVFYETVREDEFSPVKNKEGLDSPATCERDQIALAARMLEACGVAVPRASGGEPRHKIEIAATYAWDLDSLKAKVAAADIRIDGDRLFAD
jgi:UDP-N-acetylglucosamine/UDP-N-acetylgalactosamine diphosphorylase